MKGLGLASKEETPHLKALLGRLRLARAALARDDDRLQLLEGGDAVVGVVRNVEHVRRHLLPQLAARVLAHHLLGVQRQPLVRVDLERGGRRVGNK